MIDIYSELLPLTPNDDTLSIASSLNHMKKASNVGIRTVLFAPRFQATNEETHAAQVKQNVANFQSHLDEQGTPVQILASHSLPLNEQALPALEEKKALTVQHSHYVLVHLDRAHVHEHASAHVSDLQLNGYTPVLAYPERHPEFTRQPDILYKLIKQGALAYLNASSLTGKNGSPVRQFAEQLIDHNLVHMVATNAIYAGRMKEYDLINAYHFIQQHFTQETVETFKFTLSQVIAGEPLYVERPIPIKKSHFEL
ncbi:CpsB/CapC family capsule biosynthesis tyrosine phosphatase [Shouchella shacheensis]|uniref:CpsB/CapC family capsule biosynthesis tyrosine phosphatase n=1 Tax=Shouchella shacheensis TaxID=1649580 RepID=UPI00073FCA5B|nr:CpsB/CapC family capsule biosynthesis tyrosine phosphatase [Shouchella shacheensis]